MTGTEAPTTVRPCWLPRDIWWLITEKAAEEREPASLALLARLCRDMALIALPLMYGKFKAADADSRYCHWATYPSRHWGTKTEAPRVCFWRSIIMSSLGKTLYPYCLWIKTLDIRALGSLIYYINGPLRQEFYSPPLDYLEILDDPTPEDLPESRSCDTVVFEITNEIIKYIKSIADQGHHSASLTCLDEPNLNYSLSSVYFPVWASRLTGLTTLHVRDGSCLEDHITQSVVQHCPAFKHFCCHLIPVGAESKVVRFCEQLPPNTLESFSVSYGYVVEGNALFQALDKHARSLKELQLGLGDSRAYASLDRLRNCTNLKTLELARESRELDRDVSWPSLHASVYSRIVAWLQSCSQLKELTLSCIPCGSQLLQDVLKLPNVRLTDLRFKTTEANAPWYTSLHHQQSLSSLQLDVANFDLLIDGPYNGRCEDLADAISQLPELRGLNANEYFSPEEIEKISEGALNLETISLSGYENGFEVDDEHLMSLAWLPRLKDLTVRGDVNLTRPGLLRFIKIMRKDPNGQHDRFSLFIKGANFTKLTEDDEDELKAQVKRAFNGTFD